MSVFFWTNFVYPKLNGYGDNGERKVWSSCGSTYCTCFAWCNTHTLHMSVLQSTAGSSAFRLRLQYQELSLLQLIVRSCKNAFCVFPRGERVSGSRNPLSGFLALDVHWDLALSLIATISHPNGRAPGKWGSCGSGYYTTKINNKITIYNAKIY